MSKVGNAQRGNMTQTRMGESSITLSIASMRSLRGLHTFFMSKSKDMKPFYFLLFFGNSVSKNMWYRSEQISSIVIKKKSSKFALSVMQNNPVAIKLQ